MHEVALPIGRVSHPLLSFCPTLPLPICNGHMPCNPMGSCATPTGATSPALVHLAARARGWSQALLAKKKKRVGGAVCRALSRASKVWEDADLLARLGRSLCSVLCSLCREVHWFTFFCLSLY